MTIRWLLAAIHLLALGLGFGAVWLGVARCAVSSIQRAYAGPSMPIPGGASRRSFGSAPAWYGRLADSRRAARGAVPDTRAANRFAQISFIQAALVVLMVLAATGMARGYGVPAP